jgi:hypothetical protein
MKLCCVGFISYYKGKDVPVLKHHALQTYGGGEVQIYAFLR